MEPLFVDTSFNYNLDHSLFPGITDPVLRSQPALLLASSEMWTTPMIKNNVSSDYCLNERDCEEKPDLDDLDNFIDSIELANTDIPTSWMGSEELETILNDLLESAAFDDLEPMFSNCHIESVWQNESGSPDDRRIVPSSTTTTQKVNSSVSSHSLPRYDINRERRFDRGHIHEKRFCASSSISSLSSLTSSSSLSSSSSSCSENVMDTSFEDSLDLRDHSTSKRRKMDDCCNDQKQEFLNAFFVSNSCKKVSCF